MFYKIAKTLSVTASITGILMMAGACSVKSQELFYLYAALGITTLTDWSICTWNTSGYGNGSTGKGK